MKVTGRKHKWDGFWLSFVINLAFRAELFLMSMFALAAHFLFGLTLWVFAIVLGIWLITALLVTIFLTFVVGGAHAQEFRPNKNPYSARQRDFAQRFSDN